MSATTNPFPTCSRYTNITESVAICDHRPIFVHNRSISSVINDAISQLVTNHDIFRMWFLSVFFWGSYQNRKQCSLIVHIAVFYKHTESKTGGLKNGKTFVEAERQQGHCTTKETYITSRRLRKENETLDLDIHGKETFKNRDRYVREPATALYTGLAFVHTRFWNTRNGFF